MHESRTRRGRAVVSVAALVWLVAGGSMSLRASAPGATRSSAPAVQGAAVTARQEALSLSGTPLLRPATIPNEAKLLADLQAAEQGLSERPDDPEALIWVGRRQAYLWRYKEAIATFSRGIARWPDRPEFYRHRGHRYLTVRQFARAQRDFERAAALIRGKADVVEADGAPNAAGIPRSTLQFNIWYHLGLARYLQENYAGAYDAYVACMKVSTNDDAVAATSDWMWMTLMRLGRKDEARRVLDRITAKMDILENQSYHRRLLMYKGLESPSALLDLNAAGLDDTTVATQGYGVGNYYYVTGDRVQAQGAFERVVSGAGWNAFGYIAAEADLRRLLKRPLIVEP